MKFDFSDDQLAIRDAVETLCADFGDEADILMSPDPRRALKLLVTADVAAADAGDFHLKQGIVSADLWDGIFPQLDFPWTDLRRRQNRFTHNPPKNAFLS